MRTSDVIVCAMNVQEPECFLFQKAAAHGPGPADPEDEKSSGPASDIFQKIVKDVGNGTRMEKTPEPGEAAAQGPPGERMVEYPGDEV